MSAPEVLETGLVTTLRLPALTSRQAGVLRQAATGQTYRAIGAELGISVGTVKGHIHAICTRWDVSCLIEAFVVAGWLRVPEAFTGIDQRRAA